MKPHYHLDDEVLIKIGKSKREKFPYIIKKYFPEGIFIYQASQIQRLRESYEKEYDIIDNTSDRAIQGILQDVCVLAGSGLYIHPDFQKEISEDALNVIREYLKNMEFAISIRGLFEIFQHRLFSEGFQEKGEFHGILTKYFKDEFNITRSYVFKKPYNTFYEVLDKKTSKLFKFCIADFLEAFPFTEEYTILNFIMSKSNLVPLQNKCYLNLSYITLESDTRYSIKNFIDSNLEKNFISSDLLFRFVQENHPWILSQYEINNTKTMYDFVKHYFSRQYEFKGIYIGKKGTHIPTKNEQVLELIENQDEVDLQTWIKKQESLGIRIISFHSFLEEINEDFIRVSAYRIIRKHLLEIEEEDISQIKEFLFSILESKNVFRLNDLELYHRLPRLNYDWNVYFLTELIERFIPELKVIKKILTYLNMDIYITQDKRINSIDDIERYI